MIRDITIGQYFPTGSFLHKLDPRSKIILVLCYLVLIFACRNFFGLGLIVALTLLFVAVSKVSFKLIFKGLKSIVLIIIFTSLLQLFYNDKGDILLEFWKIKITTGGVFTAIFMAVRICCLILVSSLLTYTTSPTLLTDAIERLLSPLNKIHVPVHTLAMMMTIALRFIPTLIEEIDHIMSAQKARGASLDTGSLTERAKALIPIFVPLFINSFRRAFDLAFAMECRCYHGGAGRTRLRVMKLGYRDAIAFAVTTIAIVGVILFNIFFKSVI
jgi:energy-coupling factor transport system permease protein